MDIKIEGNPGTGNTFQTISQEIHIGTVQNYLPNATTVINNYGMSGEKSTEKKSQKGAKDGATDDSALSSPNNRQFERLQESEVSWASILPNMYAQKSMITWRPLAFDMELETSDNLEQPQNIH